MTLVLLLLSGITLLLLGGHYLIRHAVELAAKLIVSPLVIGLTIVTVGIAAPEFVTAAATAWNRHTDVAISNVISSSIFNLLEITGITALVSPIDVAAQFIETEIGILFLISACVVILARHLAGGDGVPGSCCLPPMQHISRSSGE